MAVCNVILAAEATSSCALFHGYVKILKKQNTSFEQVKSLEEHHLSNTALNTTEKMIGNVNARLSIALKVFKARLKQGLEQPGLVEGVHVDGRGVGIRYL